MIWSLIKKIVALCYYIVLKSNIKNLNTFTMTNFCSKLLIIAMLVLSTAVNAQQQSDLMKGNDVSVVKSEILVATDYPGFLNIDTYNENSQSWESVAVNESKTITITEYTDGTCDVLLPNLYLSTIGASLGDILVEDVTVTQVADGSKSYKGTVAGMPLLGGLLKADVALSGTITADGNVNMIIDVVSNSTTIKCTFTNNKVANDDEKGGVSANYSGYLNVNIYDEEADEWGAVAVNEMKSITITEYENGTCDFLLPNLYLSSLEMSLGDIFVEGATVTKDDSGLSTYNGVVEDMPLLGGNHVADVTLNGTITAAGVVDMVIDVLWEGIPIKCTFTTDEVVVEEEKKEGVTTEYPGYLNGSVYDAESDVWVPIAENESKTVSITEYGDGTCDFLLPNFSLPSLNFVLGDILLEDVSVVKDAEGTSMYNGFADDMSFWSGQIIADVTLTGTISAEGIMSMTIDVLWEEIPIRGTITTNEVDGVEAVVIDENAPTIYYNLQGVKVANPENGVFVKVQGGKASKVAM